VVTRLWTDSKSIKFALYSQQYRTSVHMSRLTPDLTHLLLLSLSLFPAYDPDLTSLSHRAEFLVAIQSFLSHPDPKVRRLGMLVAEILSELTIRESDDNNAQTEEEEMAELQAGFETSESEKQPRTSRGPKRLKFGEGMWGGEGEGKEECRRLRECVGVNDLAQPLSEDPSGKKWLLRWDQVHIPAPAPDPRPAPINRGRQPETKSRPAKEPKSKSKPKPKIVMLDPDQEADPLQGYAPQSPSSSRSPSPTPSYLEEVAADPTLALDSAQNKKASRPVYVQQLIMLLKEREKPEYIEMGLKWGEGLVRAKRSFGTELCMFFLFV
jgi:telomere length regulation protein